MIYTDIKYNLRRLREKVFGEGYDKSSKDQVIQWEKEFERLKLQDDFANMASTKFIIQELKDRLKIHIYQRMKETDAFKLHKLDAHIEDTKYFLSLVSPDYAKEIENLNEVILNELQ